VLCISLQLHVTEVMVFFNFYEVRTIPLLKAENYLGDVFR